MNVLITRNGAYRPYVSGAFRDDDSLRIDEPEDKAEDRQAEYEIEPTQ